jgi:hypothetical protein
VGTSGWSSPPICRSVHTNDAPRPNRTDGGSSIVPHGKESEVSAWTHYSHGSRLGHFTRWCDEERIDNLNAITGRDLKRYKLWRRDDGDINNVTLKTQMDTLRVFIR